MLKKYINENTIENIKRDGYLIIDGEKHLVMNIHNQPIEILNSNGIYEYVEDVQPETSENQYLETYYYVEENIIHKGYQIKELEILNNVEFVD